MYDLLNAMNNSPHNTVPIRLGEKRIHSVTIVAFFSLVEARRPLFTPEVWKGIALEVQKYLTGKSEHECSYQSRGAKLDERFSDGICSYFLQDKNSTLYVEFLQMQFAEQPSTINKLISHLLETEEGTQHLINLVIFLGNRP
jgi:hypothetical protein